jgi:hypothetical protein
VYRVADHPGYRDVFKDMAAAPSPDPRDCIGIDDRVHRDDAQTKALGLADQHAIEGIAMMPGEFLKEAAVVDGWR